MPVKVMSLDEPRSMDNGTMVCEGLVGDETGTVIMSFWNDEIETAQTDVVLDLKDARANLVRGHMRLSLGKKGSMKESDIVLDNIKLVFTFSGSKTYKSSVFSYLVNNAFDYLLNFNVKE